MQWFSHAGETIKNRGRCLGMATAAYRWAGRWYNPMPIASVGTVERVPPAKHLEYRDNPGLVFQPVTAPDTARFRSKKAHHYRGHQDHGRCGEHEVASCRKHRKVRRTGVVGGPSGGVPAPSRRPPFDQSQTV